MQQLLLSLKFGVYMQRLPRSSADAAIGSLRAVGRPADTAFLRGSDEDSEHGIFSDSPKSGFLNFARLSLYSEVGPDVEHPAFRSKFPGDFSRALPSVHRVEMAEYQFQNKVDAPESFTSGLWFSVNKVNKYCCTAS